MAFIEIEDLSFAYPERDRLAVDKISLKIEKGDFVLVCGQSGSGKTTLLRLLKPALAPHGMCSGAIRLGGRDINEFSPREQAEKIGFVMQDPETQTVTDKVWHELAFGLENLDMPRDEIRLRVAETAAFFGIEDLFRKSTSALSGGQKQLLSLAAVTAMRPELIILDEPTAQLDPIAAHEFLNMLGRINSELGITIVISEHELDGVYRRADICAVMDGGGLLCCDTPAGTAEFLYKEQHPMLCALPSAVRIGEAAGRSCMTVPEASAALAEYFGSKRPDAPPKRSRSGETVLKAKGLCFRYEKDGRDVISDLDTEVRRGDIYALLGCNGSGKSTVLKVFAGLLRPYGGSVRTDGRVLLLPQDPVDIFTHKTVYDDLADTYTTPRKAEEISELAELTEITDILDSHPFDVSGGELQRAAIAKLLLSKPDILLLDEPTKGMDDFYKIKLGSLLKELTENGLTVILVSHDTEFCAQYATRCAMLFDAENVSEGEPHDFFSRTAFYTTDASRISRVCADGMITTDEVLAAMGKSTDIRPQNRPRAAAVFPETESLAKTEKKARSKRTLFAALMIVLLIPLVLYFGISVFNDRKYYFISVIIIFMTMLPFFMIFENRLARTRELMLIAMLCALTCLGRAAFFMVPEFKPMCAMIIISGACLGAEAGFMTGAVSGFVSNFFFGQGPWTPWQMFTLGIIGFLTGILCRMGILRKSRSSLAVYGFAAVLLIYGGIMNPASVIMYQPDPNLKEILLAYASGLPVDLIHAFGTSVFLALIGGEMIEKIERVKVKFGLLG